MSSKLIELSIENFREASKIKGNDEFCFIIGGNKIYCHLLVAAFLSRKVLNNLFCDSTINSYEITATNHDKGNNYHEEQTKFLHELITNFRIELTENQITNMKNDLDKLTIKSNSKEYLNTLIYSYLFIIEKLDNEELRKQFSSIFFSNQQPYVTNNKEKNEEEIKEEINYLQRASIFLQIIEFIKNNNNDQISIKQETRNIYNEFYSTEYSKMIDDISSHFYLIDDETITDMNSVILYDVLKSPQLKIDTEEKLLHLLLHWRTSHYKGKQEKIDEDDFFLENVHFEYLSVESITEFIKEIEFKDLNEKIWSSVCKRLILPFENKTKNDRTISQQQQQKQQQQQLKVDFPYQNDQQLNGIIKHLNDITNGNSHSNHTIEITCSKLCCGSIETLVDFNNIEGFIHIRSNPKPRWLQIDFKSRRIQINNYLLRTSNGQHDNHIRSWNVEISNDGSNWEKIDEQNEVNELNGYNRIKSFDVEMTKPFRFIRFITSKPNFYNDGGFSLGKLELFGNIISE